MVRLHGGGGTPVTAWTRIAAAVLLFAAGCKGRLEDPRPEPAERESLLQEVEVRRSESANRDPSIPGPKDMLNFGLGWWF